MTEDTDPRNRSALLEATSDLHLSPDLHDVERRLERRARRQRRGAVVLGVGAAVVAVGVGLLVTRSLDRRPGTEPTITPPMSGSVPSSVPGPVPEGKLLLQGGPEILVHGAERSIDVGPGVVHDISPDGRRALVAEFTTHPTHVTQDRRLFAEDIETRHRMLLVQVGPTEDIGPARWSPDGTRVAYQLAVYPVDPSKEHPGPTYTVTVCVVEVSAPAPRCFDDLRRVLSFDWSPDGSRLVVESQGQEHVQIVSLGTGGTSLVLPPDGTPSIRAALERAGYGGPVQFAAPIWSPSGRYLAAMVFVEGLGSVPMVFAEDGRFVAMGTRSTESIAMAWSSAADVLAYTRSRAAYRTTGVFVLDLVSGQSTLLVDSADLPSHVTSLAWSPSGRWLALSSGGLLIVDVDNGSSVRVDTFGGDAIDWEP